MGLSAGSRNANAACRWHAARREGGSRVAGRERKRATTDSLSKPDVELAAWQGAGVDPPHPPTCRHPVTPITSSVRILIPPRPPAVTWCAPRRLNVPAQTAGSCSAFRLGLAPRPSAALSQKLRKVRNSLLTGWDHPTIHHLTNEGGAPLATKKFASTTALAGNHREPRYATLYRVRSASERSTTLRLRCLFFDNCILKKEKRGRHCPAEPLALPGAFGSNRDFGGHVSRE